MNIEVMTNLIKSHVKDYIESGKLIDKFLTEQMKQVDVLRGKKKEGASFNDLKVDIIENFENSQISTFVLEDMKGILAKLSLLSTLASLAEIDLALSSQDKELLEFTVNQHKQLCAYKEGSIEPYDKEVFEVFKAKTSEKYLTEPMLLDIYNSI